MLEDWLLLSKAGRACYERMKGCSPRAIRSSEPRCINSHPIAFKHSKPESRLKSTLPSKALYILGVDLGAIFKAGAKYLTGLVLLCVSSGVPRRGGG